MKPYEPVEMSVEGESQVLSPDKTSQYNSIFWPATLTQQERDAAFAVLRFYVWDEGRGRYVLHRNL